MALSFARPKSNDKNIIKKSKTVTTRTSIRSGGNNLAAQIQSIVAIANQKLANHKDDYILIREPDQLYEYMKEMRLLKGSPKDLEKLKLLILSLKMLHMMQDHYGFWENHLSCYQLLIVHILQKVGKIIEVVKLSTKRLFIMELIL